jgi:hypothetical protein
MAFAALSLTPVRAWAEEHSHCEEPAPAVSTAPAEMSAVVAEWSTPAGPCGECPDASCSSHRQCAAGTVPVVAESPLSDTAVPSASATGLPRLAVFGRSFDPTPPTPPPNLRTR